jgi:ribosome recycling factor
MSEVVTDLLAEAKDRMTKSAESTRTEFGTLRTGRANPQLLDRITVSYYGTMTPLKQLAQVGVPEPRLLTVTPFDKSSLKEIERSIAESDLGLNPGNDGNMIRLPIPELTQDRRKEMVRIARNLAEDGRIAVRNVRRDVIGKFKDLRKDGDLSEDDERRAEADLQKVTDAAVAQIDAALKGKEAEIMEV